MESTKSTARADSAPDPGLAIEKYRRHAAGYDSSAQRTMGLRRRVIGMLALRPGETVIDVASGTGLSLPLLREAVGPSGRVIGIEVSPEMMAIARARCACWPNVSLVEAPVEQADPGARFDAALFNYTHDVLQSPEALARLFSFAKPGARIAIAGIKHPPPWLFPLRLYRLIKARPYVTTLSGLDRPWRLVESRLANLSVRSVMLGTNYIAYATAKG